MRPMLWSSPFSNCSTHNGIPIMVAALVLLYFTIGVSMFAGFAFLVITIPSEFEDFRTVVHWYREAVTRR